MKLLKIKYSYYYSLMNGSVAYKIEDMSLLFSFDDKDFPKKLEELKKEIKSKARNGIYEIIEIERL